MILENEERCEKYTNNIKKSQRKTRLERCFFMIYTKSWRRIINLRSVHFWTGRLCIGNHKLTRKFFVVLYFHNPARIYLEQYTSRYFRYGGLQGSFVAIVPPPIIGQIDRKRTFIVGGSSVNAFAAKLSELAFIIGVCLSGDDSFRSGAEMPFFIARDDCSGTAVFWLRKFEVWVSLL